MIFISSVWEDISRYYKGTYVKFKEMGDRLFYIRRVDHISVQGQDENGTEFELCLNDDYPYEVDYILPNKSYFQAGKRAVMLQRIPAKQYQRGISSSNTQLCSLNKLGGIAKHDMGFDMLKLFVTKQTYPTFLDALRNKERNISVALNQRMAYVPDASAIFVDFVPVAMVDRKARTISMSRPIFKAEVEKLVANTEYKVI